MNSDQRDPQTHEIIGAAFEVHRQLGRGFLESVYHEALCVEFALRGISFCREAELPILYKGERLACFYRADFVCYESIIVEIKALGDLTGTERAQVINYLKAANLPRGLLINFGADRLQFKRFVNSRLRPSASSADNLSPPGETDA